MSNITGGDEGSFSSGEVQQQPEKHSNPAATSTNSNGSSASQPPQKQPQPSAKKKRNLPGTPGMYTRYICIYTYEYFNNTVKVVYKL